MIRLEAVHKTFGKIPAVSGLTLEIQEGETLALLGTSGCGKSTTLKMINGLIRPTSGQIWFDGRSLDYERIYATRLQMGYVIQEAGLFPHLDVFQNISIMARMLKWPMERRRSRVRELLERVGLAPELYENKRPAQLSGGEQQRVGAARALMLDPPCLLMDEPFGALDPLTRKQLQDDFAALKQKLNKTVVLVTHDVGEAFKLADRIALMREGRLVQAGAPEALKRRPANDFVKAFLEGAA